MKLLMLNHDTVQTSEPFLPAPEKIISGHPVQQIWPHYSNQSNVFHTGIWQAQVGKWHVSYSEDEYCHILEGISVVTNAAGEAMTVQAGDEFVIPAGFVGTWEVVQMTRKNYVVYENETVLS